ncbi:phosphatidate cytidylyltransferase [Tessaracoccus sp. MC1679]|uniref:phosphatidate cytidylyltransferase n=1 Tax=Tessaracoccus sp. MC1679 TaxID=2760313 RepID=UPI001600691B|nr:phosphatidate cytidylyltransferase [Tessaracoccus sp. MC1679]MBB1515810.1 phosphatidate cytidylyltransferase [Tessaracoccus sp. MC1679]
MTTSDNQTHTPKAGRDLPVAIGVGVALFVSFAVGLIWFPWLFIGLVAVGLSAAAVEVHRALLRKGMRAEILPIVAGTALSVVGGYLAAVTDMRVTPTSFVIICLGATTIVALAWRLFRGAEGFIRDVAASALVIAYIPLLGMFVPLLMAAPDGQLRILTVIACVVASDTGAYGVGSLIGRHKLAPHISPGKTWEGLAGGVAVTTAVAVLASVFLLGAPWWVGVPLGVLVSLAATVGDLVESLLKRDAGIKDMSNFLPGHGGVMDRLDSMLVAVPVGWLVLHLALGG